MSTSPKQLDDRRVDADREQRRLRLLAERAAALPEEGVAAG